MANYADFGQRPELEMSGLKLEKLAPFWRLISKSPTNTVFTLVLCGSLTWAASNALFGQDGGHPSPLWSTSEQVSPVTPPVAVETTPPARPTASEDQTMPAEVSPQVIVGDYGPVSGNPDAFLVQSKLADLGYFKEKVDGYYGPNTATAIRQFEVSKGWAPTGAISPELMSILSGEPIKKSVAPVAPVVAPVVNTDPLLQIAQQATAEAEAAASQVSAPQITADMVMKVQNALESLGYDVGKVDGIAGASTETAIRRFETFYNYDQTGKVSLELIDMLQAANAEF